MTLHRTGPGKAEIRENPKSYWIYNFDIDGDALKDEHTKFLTANVVPILNAGGSVRVIGLTDRTGATAYNQGLSERRVASTIKFLRGAATASFAVAQQTGFGELLAEKEGELDGSTDENFRAVLIFTSSTPTPPPPPPPQPQPAPTMTRRITQRNFTKIDSENFLDPNPPDPLGDAITALGSLLAGQVVPESVVGIEGTPIVQLQVSTLRVNKVVISTDTHETLNTGLAASFVTVTTTTITYTWGVPSPMVTIETQAQASFQDQKSPVTTKTTTLPRADAESKPFVVPPNP